MGAFAAHGQAGPVQMADGDLEDDLLGAVVDGQVDVDLGNFDVGHDAVSGHVQELFVLVFQAVIQNEGIVPAVQRLVVGPGLLPEGGVVLFAQMGHLLGVGADGPTLVEGVPPVAEGRVQQ